MPALLVWSERALAASAPVAARVGAATDWVLGALAFGRVIWSVLLKPVVIYLALLAVVSSLVAAASWAAIRRLALGGAVQ
jgi:hypothetical protein